MEAVTNQNPVLPLKQQNSVVLDNAIEPCAFVRIFTTTTCIVIELALSILVYGTAIGMIALGKSLATKTVCSLSLASLSKALVVFGQMVGAGAVYLLAVNIIYGAYRIVKGIHRTLHPYLAQSINSFTAKISSAASSYF